jgi:hypothetical protein
MPCWAAAHSRWVAMLPPLLLFLQSCPVMKHIIHMQIEEVSFKSSSIVVCASIKLQAAVEEYRPPGASEQKIFADRATNSVAQRVWDRCTIIAYLSPEVGVSGSS